MPPRQGHSQLISPVSGLKAPSEEASSSSAEGSEGEGVDGDGPEEVVDLGMVVESGSSSAMAETTERCLSRELGERVSRVGSVADESSGSGRVVIGSMIRQTPSQ